MRALGIVIKYLLWSLFSIILFLLLVGLAKTKWSVSGYIDFLNTNDWSVFSISQPSTRADPFWPTSGIETSIEDLLMEEDVEVIGIDVSDSLFESDLGGLSDGIFTEEEEFGFSTDDTHNASETSTIQQLIEQRR